MQYDVRHSSRFLLRGLVVCPVSSHYLNQCWLIITWTPRSKINWNVILNSDIFGQEMYFKMSPVKLGPFCQGHNCGAAIVTFFAHEETRVADTLFKSLRTSDAYMRQSTNYHCSDNGLSPGRRQAIIWTNAGILLIRTLGTHFSVILREIHTFSINKTHLKISSVKWWQLCLGLNVVMQDKHPFIPHSQSNNCCWPVPRLPKELILMTPWVRNEYLLHSVGELTYPLNK